MADTIDAVQVDPPPPPPPAPPAQVVDPPPVETAIPVAEPPPEKQGCMAKRSGIEKVLIILLIIIVIIIVLIAIAFVVFLFFSKTPEGTCLTDGCVKSASRLKDHMDDSLDPCNSFYEYSCRGWSSKQILGPGQNKIDVETQLYSEHLVKLRAILNVPPESEEVDYSKKAKLFYQSCMNLDKLEKLGSEPFQETIDEIGKFPTLDSTWNATNGDFKFKEMLIKLAKLSSLPFFQINIEHNTIYLTDAKLGLGNSEIYLGSRSSKELYQYHKWMVNALVLLGAEDDVAEEDVAKVIDFEISLAKLMRTAEEKASATSVYKKMEIDTFQVKYPWIQWLEILQAIAKPGVGKAAVVYFTNDVMVTIQEPKYFDQLGALINGTSKRVLANYMMSRLLPLTDHLGEQFVDNSNTFYKKVYKKQSQLRWKFCVLLTEEKFSQAVSRMFMEKYFSKDSKTYVEEIVGDVTNVLQQRLEGNGWMSYETRQTAVSKLENMDVKIGYPEKLYEKDYLENFYKDVIVNEFNYLENHVSLLRFNAIEDLKKYLQIPDEKAWTFHPTALTGRYSIETNELELPAGFLQTPVFSVEYPSAMNYAGVAAIVGREIMHGFDKLGKDYDAEGNEKSWWTARDVEGFESRSACFIKQWGCYKWDGMSMNGEKTLAENIAYNAGLKHAYEAYLNRIERLGSEEKRLPGTKLNNHQVFFIGYAQMWCAKYGDTAKQEFLESSAHPPFPYRVFGTLQNSDNFAEVFKCGMGTRMNPREKCSMW